MNTDTCYTCIDAPGGHFRILSGSATVHYPPHPVTVTIIEGNDSTEPGKKHFAVKFDTLRTCGCGRWRWAKKQEAKR